VTGLVLVPALLAELAVDVDLEVYDGEIDPASLDRAEFFVPVYMGPPENLALMRRMPRLQVCQLLTAGFDNAVPFLPAGVTLCNAAGVHDSSTAELAVGLIVASLRGIDDAARDMPAGHWGHQARPALADRRVVVIGAGGVGNAVRRRLEPFECSVAMVGRTARDGVHAMTEIPELLPAADVVVLAVPLDESTSGLVDSAFLARMRPGALLVNVARGGVVVTDALVEALVSGRVTAALDVTDPEPLPPDHPLWTAPGVLITPHVGGNSSAFLPRARRLVAAQVAAWAAGRPVVNQVLPRPG
jgi:phosphoglycerate dehydrogenase-like enzyme